VPLVQVAEPAKSTTLYQLEELRSGGTAFATNRTHCARPLSHSFVDDSNWEPDGVTLQVRFCEEPGTNRHMAEISWHRRETRRQTEKTNFRLAVGKNPAYSPGRPKTYHEIED
jgi:hypothetical protein